MEKPAPIKQQLQHILVYQFISPFTFSKKQFAFRIASNDVQFSLLMSPRVATPPAPGVIEYPLKALGLCAGITGARYTTTTEVYPDSPRATPEQCNDAQAAAVHAGFDFALASGSPR